MRRIRKKEFLLLPYEAVYCEDTGSEPKGLNIKVQSLGDSDFIYQDVCGNPDAKDSKQHWDWLNEAEEDDKFDFPLTFDCASRDGLFEDNFYYVHTKDEVQCLIARLNKALATM